MTKTALSRLLAAAAAACLLFSGCSSSSSYDTGNAAASSPSVSSYSAPTETADADYGMETAATGATDSAASEALASQKLVQYMDYDIETLDFDQSVAALEQLCADLGGYVQEASRSGDSVNSSRLRSAHYVLRIPSGQLEQFKGDTEKIGTVCSSSVWTDNITESYYDTESRLKSLRVQEERLLALMEKSETLADVIELEQALADVTYEIESLTSSLRRYDTLVDYATITIALSEVVQYTDVPAVPKNLGERIGQRFSATLDGMADFGEELLILIVGCSPVLLVLGGLFCAIFFPIWHHTRKKEKKAAPSIPQGQKPQE